jgi:hypothetical protein
MKNTEFRIIKGMVPNSTWKVSKNTVFPNGIEKHMEFVVNIVNQIYISQIIEIKLYFFYREIITKPYKTYFKTLYDIYDIRYYVSIQHQH